MGLVVQVGVVGYTTPDTPFLASPGPNITFLSLYPSVQNAVRSLLLVSKHNRQCSCEVS